MTLHLPVITALAPTKYTVKQTYMANYLTPISKITQGGLWKKCAGKIRMWINHNKWMLRRKIMYLEQSCPGQEKDKKKPGHAAMPRLNIKLCYRYFY